MLIPDNRDEFQEYDKAEPFFGPAPTALLEGLTSQADLEVHIISCAKIPMLAPTKLASNIWFHQLHVERGVGLRSLYSGCVRAIRRKLREIEPDLVHGQGTERYCGLAAVYSGFPNLITIHGNMRGMAHTLDAKPGSFYWCNALLESYTVKRTNGVVCNSAYTEKLAQARAKKIWRVPNALRPIFFGPRSNRGPNPEPVILSIGSIISYKQQIEVLEVASRLFEDGHRFQLQFIGKVSSDGYGAKFTKLINNPATQRFARQCHPTSDRELLGLFDAADALIHFSREESFGLVVAEALARNLKFFGARAGGIPDISEGIEMAELYQVNDWVGLRAGLAAWMRAGFLRPISAATEMARRYHPSVVARRHMDVYSELLS